MVWFGRRGAVGGALVRGRRRSRGSGLRYLWASGHGCGSRRGSRLIGEGRFCSGWIDLFVGEGALRLICSGFSHGSRRRRLPSSIGGSLDGAGGGSWFLDGGSSAGSGWASSWRRRTSSASSRFGEPNRSSAAEGVSAVTSSAFHWLVIRMGSLSDIGGNVGLEDFSRLICRFTGGERVVGKGPLSGAVISRASTVQASLGFHGPFGQVGRWSRNRWR